MPKELFLAVYTYFPLHTAMILGPSLFVAMVFLLWVSEKHLRGGVARFAVSTLGILCGLVSSIAVMTFVLAAFSLVPHPDL